MHVYMHSVDYIRACILTYFPSALSKCKMSATSTEFETMHSMLFDLITKLGIQACANKERHSNVVLFAVPSVYAHVYMDIYINTCTHTGMSVFLYVCTCVYVYIYTYMYIYITMRYT